MTGVLHDDELVVDEGLVERLLATQLPHLARRPLRRLSASGSSNVLFRLGPDLLVRLPRQPGGSASIEKEARWAGMLADRLPVAVPEVVEVGHAGEGYPESWSVVRWVDGDPPPPYDGTAERSALAERLGAVVAAMVELPVPDPSVRDDLHWYRCDPLPGLDETVEEAVADLGRPGAPDWGLDLPRVTAVWEHVRTAQPGPVAATWIHADLVAENLLVRDGALVAVLDLGGLAVGRPAVDLMGAWELFGPADRARFRAVVGADDAAWLTGAGWALALALMTLTYYGDTMPGRCASRVVMARQVLDELG